MSLWLRPCDPQSPGRRITSRKRVREDAIERAFGCESSLSSLRPSLGLEQTSCSAHTQDGVDGFDQPIEFGVHGGIKHFYGMEPRRDLLSTLDYMIAAVGG